MKKQILFFIISLLTSIAIVWGISNAATVLFPYQGGTGLGTGPNRGDILVGSSTASYARVATGTPGQALLVSSTAPYLVAWDYPIVGGVCGGTDKISSISPTGTIICSEDQTAASPESGWRLNTPFVHLATSTNSVGVGATSSIAKFYIQGTNIASTTLFLQGMAGQTGDILRVASSGGEIYFTIDSLGLVSSTELRANSSTFGNITNLGLTASRLIQSSASKLLSSVANLTSFITGTPNKVTVTDNGSGGVTISLPSVVDLGASSELIVSSGTVSGNLFVGGDIGSSANRIGKLWASDLDSTLGTIGTITISSAASGNLVVNNGNLNLASDTKSYQIGGVLVLSSTTLGSGVVNSSLTSLGTISNFLFGNATGTGNLQAATLVSTGTTTVNSLDVINANEYRTRSASIIIVNPDNKIASHSSSSLAFSFDVPATLISVQCYSRPSGTSTIQLNRRSSETPGTSGTNLLSANLACGTSNASTTSFASSSIPAGTRIHIELVSVAGVPSSTTIFVNARNND